MLIVRCFLIAALIPFVWGGHQAEPRRVWAQAVPSQALYLPAVLRTCVPGAGGCTTLPGASGWSVLANTRLRPVCAADQGFPEVRGASGCGGITEAWNGGAFDSARNRLIILGGGHNDYYGNELYALDLDDQRLTRLNDPGYPIGDFTTCQEAIANGTQPNSRHTYDGVEYLTHLDRLFIVGGSLACGNGNFGQGTWTYDFASGRWQRMTPTGPLPAALPGIVTAYDPVSRLVFVHDTYFLYTYDVAADRYTRLSEEAGIGYHLNGVLDPVNRRFVIAGWDATVGDGRVYVYDISDLAGGSAQAFRVLNTQGGDAVIDRVYPGLAYDPVRGRITGWAGGSSVYSLNLGSGVWTAHPATGGPGAQLQNGTIGRWQYAPGPGVFVYYGDVDQEGYVFRLP